MMKVRYIGKTDLLGFKYGCEYEVISVERGWYRIVNPFTQEDFLYPPKLFELIKE